MSVEGIRSQLEYISDMVSATSHMTAEAVSTLDTAYIQLVKIAPGADEELHQIIHEIQAIKGLLGRVVASDVVFGDAMSSYAVGLLGYPISPEITPHPHTTTAYPANTEPEPSRTSVKDTLRTLAANTAYALGEDGSIFDPPPRPTVPDPATFRPRQPDVLKETIRAIAAQGDYQAVSGYFKDLLFGNRAGTQEEMIAVFTVTTILSSISRSTRKHYANMLGFGNNMFVGIGWRDNPVTAALLQELRKIDRVSARSVPLELLVVGADIMNRNKTSAMPARSLQHRDMHA